MTLSIIIIGDEILLGQVTDTNSGHISRMLGQQGFATRRIEVVGDDGDAIAQAIDDALKHSDLVITTGGLGPTKDDITKHALCRIFGCQLRLDADSLSNVERVFAARGLALNDLTRQQAYVPEACRVIRNQLGTAPIMWFEREGHVLIAMPGVPFETVGMMERVVAGEIKRRFQPDSEMMHHTVIARGLPESGLAELLAHYEASLPAGMHLAYLPVPGYVRLRLDGVCPILRRDEFGGEFAQQVAALKSALGQYMLHDGDASPAEILLQRLRARGLTVATAESCTGGNIAHAITSVAGCSDCYLGGVVSYSNAVKANVLGVDMRDIEAQGAVSETVARQMAEGARRAIGADCAVATIGIAGPGGAVPGKPVGTVWIAACTPAGTSSRLLRLPGDRQRVIGRATTEALLMLAEALL